MSLDKEIQKQLVTAATDPHVPARVRAALEAWRAVDLLFNQWFRKEAKVRLTTDQLLDDILAQDDDCFDATGDAWLKYQAQPTPENEAVLLRALTEWSETRTRLMQKYAG
ncbi:hypothetical protein BHS06_10550 [Myxococcus xanthus]|uniref:hypothetical protein n=1 Tax=Myxococcus xanthus TaxID=34 RepID=UPI00112C7AEB|nr:hypothetical protein [Myxococcus xanthus]QDE89357.1 hypothetical protein BHS06_10550 [Myxococcus xanthus]